MSTAEQPRIARLVTFLGRGKYHTVEYEFAGRRASSTPYVCRALAELLRPSEIVVLATEDAERDHGQGLRDALRASSQPAPRFEGIPSGSAQGDLWKQFAVIKNELRGSDGSVMLDITHGLRSQPFFAAAVATFVHAVDDKPPDLRVFYGAYDPQHPESGAAILELSEFIALLDWSRALAMFLKTGRAEDAAEATQRLGGALAKAWAEGGKQGERPNLDALGKGLREFGVDLETLRTGDLLLGRGTMKESSAARLLKATQETKKLAVTHAPPLADILDRVAAMAEPIAGAGHDLSGSESRKAVTALAELYLRLGRYLEATASVREGWVNLYARKTALVPGSDNFDNKERKCAEDRAHKRDAVFREVTDRRNDFLHAQYRQSAQKAKDVIQTTEALLNKLRIAEVAVENKEIESKAPRGACFINLSNHPSANWGEAQTKAALAFADRIEDIAFPAVPPDADERAIEVLAETCMAQIPPGTSHALVQGEFTLTVELVRRLQVRGITCLAATSTRNVEEADGRRVSTFTFVRFRAYAEPGTM
ncbi:MAG TPA: TM1812 family CRISPR-associated protein [Gemmataceae bacterium]|nr:TM1812 family CRISPR-associated protein [Gemmataceae bacterium]